MKCHRVNELIELLHPAWQQDPDLNLVQFLQKLSDEAGFEGELSELTDDILIYHLKMRGSASTEAIPGLKKIMKKTSKQPYCVLEASLKIRHTPVCVDRGFDDTISYSQRAAVTYID